MRKKQVVVIGGSDETQYNKDAYKIGKYIAQKNCSLLSGGRGGVMKAVSKGAYDEGGVVVGILPGDDFSEANEYCTIVIPSGIGYARNSMNILSADIIISLGGKAGTLSELAYAWHYRKPVIACSFTGGWSKKIVAEPIDERYESLFYTANSLEEVYKYIDKLLG